MGPQLLHTQADWLTGRPARILANAMMIRSLNIGKGTSDDPSSGRLLPPNSASSSCQGRPVSAGPK